ncbi:MAG: LysE/ArgO family amino acid transporter [Marinovum sp.]|nr:LysE/ArgO family amino acid transporter [Marinovum sp.]
MQAFLSGFGLGFSLILAIGAQNAFVLRQGLRREHVALIVFFCAVSDALLIAAGVAGFGAIARALPWFEPAMRYGGVAFLIWYGLRNLRSAWHGGDVLQGAEIGATSARAAVATLIGITWLNPHVYLDTLVLVGAVSANYEYPWVFGGGAMLASGVFFTILGFGARALAPFFARPRSWQILDLIIGLTMWLIAAKLVFFL